MRLATVYQWRKERLIFIFNPFVLAPYTCRLYLYFDRYCVCLIKNNNNNKKTLPFEPPPHTDYLIWKSLTLYFLTLSISLCLSASIFENKYQSSFIVVLYFSYCDRVQVMMGLFSVVLHFDILIMIVMMIISLDWYNTHPCKKNKQNPNQTKQASIDIDYDDQSLCVRNTHPPDNSFFKKKNQPTKRKNKSQSKSIKKQKQKASKQEKQKQRLYDIVSGSSIWFDLIYLFIIIIFCILSWHAGVRFCNVRK